MACIEKNEPGLRMLLKGEQTSFIAAATHNRSFEHARDIPCFVKVFPSLRRSFFQTEKTKKKGRSWGAVRVLSVQAARKTESRLQTGAGGARRVGGVSFDNVFRFAVFWKQRCRSCRAKENSRSDCNRRLVSRLVLCRERPRILLVNSFLCVCFFSHIEKMQVLFLVLCSFLGEACFLDIRQLISNRVSSPSLSLRRARRIFNFFQVFYSS